MWWKYYRENEVMYEDRERSETILNILLRVISEGFSNEVTF